MRHPLWWALGAALVVLLAALALPLWQLGRGRATVDDGDLPWAAEPLAAGGVRVMGLAPGRDTLGDAARRLGDGLQVAVVARPGEVGALEAMVEPFVAGFVSGRLVLSFAPDAAALRGWRERAPRSEAMEGGVRRFALRPEDRAAADRAPLWGLSFVPAATLTVEDVERRFGAPAERLVLLNGSTAMRYPRIGMVATVGSGARGVFEFVAPRDFAHWLGAPAAASAP